MTVGEGLGNFKALLEGAIGNSAAFEEELESLEFGFGPVGEVGNGAFLDLAMFSV